MAAPKHRRVGDSPLVRRTLIGLAVALTVLLLFMPLVLIFVQAFAEGWAVTSAIFSTSTRFTPSV
mgnify:CR=1 FL=1